MHIEECKEFSNTFEILFFSRKFLIIIFCQRFFICVLMYIIFHVIKENHLLCRTADVARLNNMVCAFSKNLWADGEFLKQFFNAF